MTGDFLEDYKLCYVKTIFSPDELWVTNYLKTGKDHMEETNQFEFYNALEVARCKETPILTDVKVGKIVIVQIKQRYYRGLVVDIFNKSARTAYEILLMDNGITIITDKSKIALVGDLKLKNRESDVIKVLLPNIQPVLLDIDYNGSLLEKIFYKRVSNTWSTAAFNFVKSLFSPTEPVYMKCIKKIDENTVEGDIYLVKKPENKLESLHQMLCVRNFAVMKDKVDISKDKECYISKDISICDRQKFSVKSGYECVEIKKKIPFRALSARLKDLNLHQKQSSILEIFNPKI